MQIEYWCYLFLESPTILSPWPLLPTSYRDRSIEWTRFSWHSVFLSCSIGMKKWTRILWAMMQFLIALRLTGTNLIRRFSLVQFLSIPSTGQRHSLNWLFLMRPIFGYYSKLYHWFFRALPPAEFIEHAYDFLEGKGFFETIEGQIKFELEMALNKVIFWLFYLPRKS